MFSKFFADPKDKQHGKGVFVDVYTLDTIKKNCLMLTLHKII